MAAQPFADLARSLSLAFVLPYGEHSDGFFPDTLLGQLCALARDAGHRAVLARVYYDGRNAEADREIGRRLQEWLAKQEADLVVLERLFDPAPVLDHVRAVPGRRCLLVTRGDSFEPVPGIDLVLGSPTGRTATGRTRRSPTFDELTVAFEQLLPILASGADPLTVGGVSRVDAGALISGPDLPPGALRRPFRPVVEHDVIALRQPPRIIRKYLFGNTGCPFAADPVENPHYAGAALPDQAPLARLGCAFCCMGGDYQKRPDADVVAAVVEQAVYLTRQATGLEELVLGDQHPLRYLKSLLEAASAAGVPPVRWLFAARPDTFVRELDRIDAAVGVAERTGHALELYLSGFEAFCDRELSRYNKGLDVQTQLDAVAAMRRLAAAHPRAFLYARARGHSLILWNPWTAPEDLRESVETIRAHGLAELFHELGRNRLRLYDDLPIYHAARRDGALLERWADADEGAGRRKGYNVEHPWRFLDPRTHLAYALARELRDRLGPEGELSQLAAVVDRASGREAGDDDVDRVVSGMLADLDALEAALAGLLSRRGASAPGRGSCDRATPVLFAGACDNGCAACPNRDTWLDDSAEALMARVDAVRRAASPVMLAGREPALHPDFLDAVARARGHDRRAVGVVTNGRRFADERFARAAVRAGLVAASIKIFAPDAVSADRIAGAAGAYEQALTGIRNLRAGGVAAVELRAPLHRQNLESFATYAALARQVGADHLRVEAALDAIGLVSLGRAARAVRELSASCAEEGVALEASPLQAATRFFEWLPRPRPLGRAVRGASD